MGQKTHPIGFRLGVSKDWRAEDYAGRELPASFPSVADARAAWQAAPLRTRSGVVAGRPSRP